jgi:Tautomerase enzyme
MPFVNVKLIEGVFTPERKQWNVGDLTDAMVAIEGENGPILAGHSRRAGQPKYHGACVTPTPAATVVPVRLSEASPFRNCSRTPEDR